MKILKIKIDNKINLGLLRETLREKYQEYEKNNIENVIIELEDSNETFKAIELIKLYLGGFTNDDKRRNLYVNGEINDKLLDLCKNYEIEFLSQISELKDWKKFALTLKSLYEKELSLNMLFELNKENLEKLKILEDNKEFFEFIDKTLFINTFIRKENDGFYLENKTFNKFNIDEYEIIYLNENLEELERIELENINDIKMEKFKESIVEITKEDDDEFEKEIIEDSENNKYYFSENKKNEEWNFFKSYMIDDSYKILIEKNSTSLLLSAYKFSEQKNDFIFKLIELIKQIIKNFGPIEISSYKDNEITMKFIEFLKKNHKIETLNEDEKEISIKIVEVI